MAGLPGLAGRVLARRGQHEIDLDLSTKAEMRAFAERRRIDLPSRATRADMITAIKAHLGQG